MRYSCSTVSAFWCPVCGDCTCPRRAEPPVQRAATIARLADLVVHDPETFAAVARGMEAEREHRLETERDPACPLHGDRTKHRAKPAAVQPGLFGGSR